jgi:transcriptional regulator with XRE-family HTH domain|tara:strand:+ start:32285 stop:32638 length:354 start_codon:yes stop_codon:yes gene_type:complete
MSTIAERIRDARLYAGITAPSELARRCGVSRSAVSQWESGDTKNIKLANLERVAEACKVDMAWLVTGKGRKEGIPLEVQQLAEAINSRPPHQRQALRALLGPADEHDNGAESATGTD